MKKDQLVIGQIYEVRARSFYVAVWTGEVFRGPAFIHGEYQLTDEGHFDDGLPGGTASPIRSIGDMLVVPPYGGQNFLSALVALNEEVWRVGVVHD